jgi:hypothetical protein
MTGINSRLGGKRVNVRGLGKWPNADCKTVYPGSIPGVASNPARQFETGCTHNNPVGDVALRLSKRDRASRLFPGSSAVEQPAVNRLVAGSNPARGAKFLFWH